MKYRSTRGGCSGLSFEQAVLTGFCPDGGVLMPESVPSIDRDTLRAWADLAYPDLVKQVLQYFIDEEEIPRDALHELVDRAFDRFSLPEVVNMTSLTRGLNVLELFHGPTLAFKDLALSCLAQFMQYFLQKRKKHVTALVGTSGDTGSAAAESVRGLSCMDIVILLPRGRCTRVQELQMTTIIQDNVHIFRADGTSDDLDLPIKKCFLDEKFVSENHVCSLNSINWARILVQIAHYIYAYLRLSPDLANTVEIVIPTGACGNVTAGCIARQMGVDIKLVCAVNTNDIVARTIQNADFSVASDVTHTLAPAMDIQVPYNMERLFYLYSGYDTDLVRSLLHEQESTGRVKVPQELHQKIRDVMSSHVADDVRIKQSMLRCWEENSYLLCPHTAVAASYHYANKSDYRQVCIATASPAKFEEAVTSAGLTPQPTDEVKALDVKPTKYTDMEKGPNWEKDWENICRETIQNITKNRKHLNANASSNMPYY